VADGIRDLKALGMPHDKIMLNFLDKHKIKYVKKVYNSDHRVRNINEVMELVISV
jgi:hypothetical protein